MSSEKLIITPRTRVAELLEAYPELEDALIEITPVFKKLQNPFLRKTIARVTTLQQAAAVAEISVHEIVNTLRKMVGQDVLEGLQIDAGRQQSAPSWYDPTKIAKKLDARPIIEQGGHPLGDVLSGIKDLKPGEVYELITPFMPAPLIERIVAQGFDHWSKKEAEDLFINYFCKK